MHITMVKKRLADGSECRKCQDATSLLKSRGAWDRINEIVWALEDDARSPGMVLGAQLGIERAPFFVVRDGGSPDAVYVSVLQLLRERLDAPAATTASRAQEIDPDDVGGI